MRLGYLFKTRRKELKSLHIKENKNAKEAERLSRDSSPYGENIIFHHIGISPGAESIRYDPGGVWTTSSIDPFSKAASFTGPQYRTEMTPRGMRVITTLGNGEEHSTLISKEEVENMGLTENKALTMLRGLKF